MTRNLYLCAAGNAEGIRLAITINRLEQRWERIILLDDNEALHGTTKVGVTIEGPFSMLADVEPGTAEVVNLVTRTTQGRDRARAKIAEYGHPFATLIHPTVDCFSVELGRELTVYQNAVLGADSRVGDGSVVLPGAVVGHGARVDRNCVLAPNGVVNARVHLEEGVYVGSNASIVPDVTIGKGATVAANSLVVGDVPAEATALGIPAQLVGAPGAEGASDGAAPTLLVPHDEVEGALRDLIRQTLGADGKNVDLGLNVNLFDAGLTSIKAIQLHDRINKVIGGNLGLPDLYRYPTIQSLAGHLSRDGEGSGMSAARERGKRRLQARRAR